MAQQRITFACGHIKTVQLSGPARQRESRARWLAESECLTCRNAQQDRERAEASERNAAANRAAGLPELEGSPKQVAWAETIRAEMLDEMARQKTRFTELLEDEVSRRRADVRKNQEQQLRCIETVLAALREIATARWFIDHHDDGWISLASLAAEGLLRPRTTEQKKAGFDPFGLNTLVFPAEEVAGPTKNGQRLRLRLTHSRWEGCTVAHPVSMTQEAADGTVTIRFGGEWDIPVDDGARTRSVSAEDFHRDRTRRRRTPGERHYWDMPPYEPGEWNEIDVPEGDVSERRTEQGQHLAVVRLVCSRWEGLYFEHPMSMVRRHRPGFVTLRFGPEWRFKVLGGKRMLRIVGWQMHEDRAAPLPRPGESLAVEQKTWHHLAFHPSRLRRGKNAWWVRFGTDAAWPDAMVFHPASMCRIEEDGTITWRFHEHWEFRVRTPEGGTVEASAEEFLKATSGWAGTAPLPGTYTREPENLDAVDEVVIPDELLEEDPLVTEAP
ncbi:hypothetical protein [Streptomyces nanshensis]|uniref:hypothetical protein n=1 Tax=Streptomyces nanshensis TaxID=518642 RepID=UPI00085BFF55|nr:hypothetical protein [Streptomyces nanshensis]